MRNTTETILQLKGKTPIVSVSCYTAPIAKVADQHADIILVGDSVGMVLYGYETTREVTLEMMLLHGKAVVNATQQALIVIDMPFGSYDTKENALENAQTIINHTGCQAVKLEGGESVKDIIAYLTENHIAVMGHIGLLPQSVTEAQPYLICGKNEVEAAQLSQDLQAITEAGAFAVVLEAIIAPVADSLSEVSTIPTIAIGASRKSDGQILVAEDLLGLSQGSPKFVKHYANLNNQINQAFCNYAKEVKGGVFPGNDHLYE